MKRGKKKGRARQPKRPGVPRPPRPARNDGRTASRRPGELFEALVALQKRLLAPGGCPWDREQTHDTLRPYLIEEAYEVLDALDSGDPAHIAEELGDLLLQVVFHAQLAAQAGRFDISDVIEHIHTKLVRRHPHVFGKVKAETAAQVLKNWDELKAEEKRSAESNKTGKAPGGRKQGEHGGQAAAASVLDGVPRTLPALIEAQQLTRKAAKVGFDWREPAEVLDKLAEEAAEMLVALALNDRSQMEEEVGDLLLVCVNVARLLNLDSEIALKKANLKFARRFREMERLAGSRGQQLSKLSSEELETLWGQAKGRTA